MTKQPLPPRHFVDLDQLPANTLPKLLTLAAAIKRAPEQYRRLHGQTLALIFEKPSTRTRISFEVGMRELGGEVVTLSGAEMQLGRGETLQDTARVLSRYVQAVMIRTDAPRKLAELVEGSSIPIINGLTNDSHPCQVLADLQTFIERQGPIAGKKVAFVGDGDNNILCSWIQAAPLLGFELVIARPDTLPVPATWLDKARAVGGKVRETTDAVAAMRGAAAVITDTWVSMHQDNALQRKAWLRPYQVNEALMREAQQAIFMHCLPAHRGEEVTDAVMDGPQSVVWDEAENRKHAQKAILLWCLHQAGF